MKPLALVVENDAGTRKLLDVLLTRFGFEVDLVASGADAVVVLQHVHYDALLVDLLLPDTSGAGILTWMSRARPELLRRVIVISSATETHLQRVREQFPDVCVIRKPFEVGEVAEAAQRVSADRVPRARTTVETFCRQSIRAGAKAGVIVKIVGRMVEPVLEFGYGPKTVESFFPMSIDAEYPLCESMRGAKPVWIRSAAMAVPEYPLLAAVWEQNETRAMAAVPLLHDGNAIGAVGWSFREPRFFGAPEQQAFTAIAESVMAWLPDGGRQSITGNGA